MPTRLDIATQADMVTHRAGVKYSNGAATDLKLRIIDDAAATDGLLRRRHGRASRTRHCRYRLAGASMILLRHLR